MSDDLICETRQGPSGAFGMIWLNRPHALNALTHAMILNMHVQLLAWSSDPDILGVIVASQQPGVFCAGGDIKSVYEHQDHPEIMIPFFGSEYALNLTIHQYPKPYITFLDGITMGGGVGISVHGSHRIATERLIWSMPETSIGFFPDVGSSYFLSRCPGKVGTFLALTSAQLDAHDAYEIRAADFIIPSHNIPHLIQELCETPWQRTNLHAQLNTFFHPYHFVSPKNTWKDIRTQIDQYFSYSTLEEIEHALAQSPNPLTQTWASALQRNAPTSLKITLALLKKAMHLNIVDCLSLDFMLVQHFLKAHDFYEGIRATLIDKDKSPRWVPDDASHLHEENLQWYFSTEGVLSWQPADFQPS